MLLKSILFGFGSVLLLTGCFRSVIQSHDITFDPKHQLQLDVYSQKNKRQADVLLFIHGGNWIHGKKSTYAFLGKRLAKKGIVLVVPDYRMGNAINYEMMAGDVALAIKWTKKNIVNFGGDSSNVFISGHSAGGHLAALVATDKQYTDQLNMNNSLKGTILIDAFGLDIYSYLKNSTYKKDSIYTSTFSRSEKTWKQASPVNHLHDGMPPFLIFLGTNTFPAVTTDNNIFFKAVKKYQPQTQLILKKHKNHFEMIFMFLNLNNKSYNQIMEFMVKTQAL